MLHIISVVFHIAWPKLQTVNSRNLKADGHPKPLVSQSKFSGSRKFTLRHQWYEISIVESDIAYFVYTVLFDMWVLRDISVRDTLKWFYLDVKEAQL